MSTILDANFCMNNFFLFLFSFTRLNGKASSAGMSPILAIFNSSSAAAIIHDSMSISKKLLQAEYLFFTSETTFFSVD